ncbi:MAG: type II toxin-antitoxin system RelE/ParE family toxin [Prochloraceae cyanobacterium]
MIRSISFISQVWSNQIIIQYKQGKSVSNSIDKRIVEHSSKVQWTLRGSKHANMRELRFYAADRVWRMAFAFDRQRQAILLVRGDKSGISGKQSYRQLIKKADTTFDSYLEQM